MKKVIALMGGIVVILSIYLLSNAKNTAREIPPTTSPEVLVPAEKVPLVLRPDGLGVVAFGATPQEALAALTPILGAPTKDTGWIDSFSPYGTCPGTTIRGIEWVNLHILFGDTVHGTRAFFGFEYIGSTGASRPLFTTEKNITLGADKVAIKAAYPQATFGEWLPGQEGVSFLRGAARSGEYLGGTLEDNKLFWIGGGIFCGE